ncbi:hypothetical protein [Amycolatopsis magusensis]|uniref:hypothetical protein n=1 Tax=Amycolatopsis magusensis TaxID=882444 RepID=UPI0037A849C8
MPPPVTCPGLPGELGIDHTTSLPETTARVSATTRTRLFLCNATSRGTDWKDMTGTSIGNSAPVRILLPDHAVLDGVPDRAMGRRGPAGDRRPGHLPPR